MAEDEVYATLILGEGFYGVTDLDADAGIDPKDYIKVIYCQHENLFGETREHTKPETRKHTKPWEECWCAIDISAEKPDNS